MGHKRPKPEHLAAKLLMIREAYNASQSQLTYALKVKISSSRISEYEHGTREPNAVMLLSYARLAQIPLESLIDDKVTPTKFRYVLAMKDRFIDSRHRFG
jgi:transcriptional regulator with XRE-family HTH domain